MHEYNYTLQLQTNIIFFLLLFVRIITFLFTIPLFGDQYVNKKINVYLALCLSFIALFFIPYDDLLQLNFLLIIFLCLKQILVGFLLGFVIKLIFSIAFIAGEIISAQIGLSFANFFDFNARLNLSLMSRFFYNLMMYIFLLLNGHLWMINIIMQSFYSIPINFTLVHKIFYIKIIYLFYFVLMQSIALSQPIIILTLTLIFVLAFLNKTAPQFSSFSIFIPMSLIIGLYLIHNGALEFINFFVKYFKFFSNIKYYLHVIE
ncbi:Flagellar biosynthetic protein FliR [Buchnera aphidicola (Thelaxes suberi)]|uniref:flagellar biosynthetic protein FliR n=1 Tax=Buchnera aphidicola TaxID=9 RepID=UPI003464DD21